METSNTQISKNMVASLVKPLEWVESTKGTCELETVTGIIKYYIRNDGHGCELFSDLNGETKVGDFQSYEAAKCAAEINHRNSIASTMDLSVVVKVVEVLQKIKDGKISLRQF